MSNRGVRMPASWYRNDRHGRAFGGTKRRQYDAYYNKDGSRTYIRKPIGPRYITQAPRELKYLDCSFVGNQIKASTDASGGSVTPTGGCVGCISVPAQGYGNQERLGQEYYIHNVQLSGVFTRIAATTSVSPTPLPLIFIALVWNKQSNFTGATSNWVFDNVTGSVNGMFPYPQRNMEYTKKYKVLKTYLIKPGAGLNFNDAVGTGAYTHAHNPTFKMKYVFRKPLKVKCNGDAANVNVVVDNSLSVIMYSDINNLYTFTGKSRLRFTG